MPTSEFNAIEIEALKTRVSNIEGNTKQPHELTQSEREAILDNIYPRILNNGVYYRTDKRGNSDYSAFQVGDYINHVDDVNKVHYTGVVKAIPLSLPADFTDSAKIDRYAADDVAL